MLLGRHDFKRLVISENGKNDVAQLVSNGRQSDHLRLRNTFLVIVDLQIKVNTHKAKFTDCS